VTKRSFLKLNRRQTTFQPQRDMLNTSASWIVLAPTLLLASAHASPPPEKIQLTIATLHAAALTSSRSPGDSTDAPFFVVSVIGPHASSASILPDSGPRSIRRDEQLGARPLTQLTLAGGDSIQVLVSVLESVTRQASDRAAVEAVSAKSRATSSSEEVEQATRLVAPLLKQGANLVGSVSLLLTNEGGDVYWRRLDCLASCKVLSGPAATALPAASGQPFGTTVELSGSGGTYHLALRASRTP
jgi:hypothetical protein